MTDPLHPAITGPLSLAIAPTGDWCAFLGDPALVIRERDRALLSVVERDRWTARRALRKHPAGHERARTLAKLRAADQIRDVLATLAEAPPPAFDLLLESAELGVVSRLLEAAALGHQP